MDKVERGMFATSLAGHDFKKLYMIVNYDDTYVYLCDGELRKTDNPKRKKYKHIQIIKMVSDEVRNCYEQNKIPDDLLIKKVIKSFGNRFD